MMPASILAMIVPHLVRKDFIAALLSERKSLFDRRFKYR
jgi:hypothetical protein